MGRPTVPTDIRTLIREMSNANPRWGGPRIHDELLKLVAADFFVVPTATYRILFVLVLLAHDRRRIKRRSPRIRRGVDGPTAARGVSVGRGASIPDPRSRSRVRWPTGHGEGDGD